MPIKVKIKDRGKCTEWERRRRDRLNDAFKNLAQLLPHHDPAKIPAKIEILEKSTEFVKELRLSNSRLLSGQAEADEKCKLIKELQDEVNKLILRVKQLTILLKKASISIPVGPDIKSLGPKRLKWSGKLKPEDVENSVIINKDSKTCEKALSEKDKETVKPNLPTAATTSVQPTPTTTSQSTSNKTTTNKAITTPTVASIIVPLKETNQTKAAPGTSSTTISPKKVSTSTVRKKDIPLAPNVSSVACQTSTTPSIVNSIISPTPVITSSPAKLITASNAIFQTATATPLQLPLQTFIIAPCPARPNPAPTTALSSQSSPIITRISNPHPSLILTKGLEGLALQKIPIKSLLKPIPKVIRRRNRKRKNEITAEKSSPKSVPSSSMEEKCEKISEKVKEVEIVPNIKPTTPATEADKSPTKLNEDNLMMQPSVSPIIEEQSNKEAVSIKDNDNEQVQTMENDETILREPKTANNENVVEKVCEKIVELIDITEDEPSIVEIERASLETNGLPNIQVEEPLSENIPVLRIIEASSAEATEAMEDAITTVVMKSNDPKASASESVTENSSLEAMEIENSETEQNRTLNEQHKTTGQAGNDIVLEKNAQVIDASTTNLESQTTSITTTMIEPIASEKEKEPLAETEENVGATNEMSAEAAEVTIVESVKTSVEIIQQHDNPVMPSNSKTSNDHTSTISILETESTPNASLVSNQLPSNIGDDQVVSDLDKRIQAEPQPLTPLKHIFAEIASSSVATEAHVLTSLDKPKESNSQVLEDERTIKRKDAIATTSRETVSTTDKISECIARSIDLIDAHDSELMELGEHWEDSGTSPKSISPTQIFLNMFPLLPRESSAAELHAPIHQHQPSHASTSNTQTPKTSLPFLPSSSNRSSFFIDAMLPDDHSVGNNSSAQVINDNIIDASTSSMLSHSPFLPLTPPQYSTNNVNQQISSPFSLSNSYYWAPVTVPSSSSTELRSSCSSSLQQSDQRNVFTTSSASATTVSSTNTLQSTTCTTKTSTENSSSLPPLPVPTTSSSPSTNKSTTSESHKSRRSKSSAAGSSGTGKIAFTFDTNLPSFSSSMLAVTPTATSKTTTPSTSVNVTWCVTTPAQSTIVSSQQNNTNPNIIASVHSTTEPTAHSGNPTTSAHMSHSCSLLDSLNPIDAAFFRPLMNALDSHEFRNLDFSGSNTLPPPPPPLPLLPPPPSKTLYSSQLNRSQTAQNSLAPTNYHDHATSIPSSFMHPHQPMQIFGSNISQHFTTENISQPPALSSGTTSTRNLDNSAIPSLQTLETAKINAPVPTVDSKGHPVTDKTSRTSGRQKSDSTKKSKSVKSSRTQPYVLPVASTSSAPIPESSQTKQGRRYDKGEASANVAPAHKAAHSYSIHAIQNQINSTPKATKTNSQKVPDFNLENIRTSSHFGMPQMQSSHAPTYHPVPTGNQSSHVERAQVQKKADAKMQKSKEEKSNFSSSYAKQSKSSRNTGTILHLPASSQVEQQNVGSKATGKIPSSQQATSKPSVVPATEHVANIHLDTDTVKQAQSIPCSNSTLSQTFNMESLHLFPEFGVGGNTRQFGTSQVHSHYQQENPCHPPVQQQSDPNVGRSHSYYFPDFTSSLETFAPVHQFQPQVQPDFANQSMQASNTKLPPVFPGCVTTSQRSDNATYFSSSSNNPLSHIPAQINQQGLAVSAQPNTSHQQQQQQRHPQQNQGNFPHHNSSRPIPQTQAVPHAPNNASAPHQQQGGAHTSQRHQTHHQQTCPPQNAAVSQSQSHNPQSSTTISATATNLSRTTGKGKQQSQTPHMNLFQASSSQHPQVQNTVSHHQHVQSQATHHHHQHQNAVQPPSHYHQPARPASSKTVNWMTDTGYRPTASTATNPAKHQRQTGSTTSTNNPFPVSKLVGSSSATVAKSQGNANVLDGNPRVQQQQPPHNSNVPANAASAANLRNTKIQRNSTTSNSGSSAAVGNNSNQPQSQSIYCAEALIRKNPPSSTDWANEFNLLPGSTHDPCATGYSVIQQHTNSNIHSHHQLNQHTPTSSETFPSWNSANMPTASYHFPGSGTSHVNPSNASTSNFSHFDHSQSQSQYQATQHQPHPQQQHQQTHGHSNNYITPPQGQRHHPTQSHSQTSSHSQSNSGGSQMPYSHQQHHSQHSGHHHHHHQGSTSSVTNFNLSTIFPEINDKRSNATAVGQAQARTSVSSNPNSNANIGSSSGNMNAPCGYHHINFGNPPGNGN